MTSDSCEAAGGEGPGLALFRFCRQRILCLQKRNHKAVILPLWFRECRHRILCLQKRKSAAARRCATVPEGPRVRARKAAGSPVRLSGCRSHLRQGDALFRRCRQHRFVSASPEKCEARFQPPAASRGALPHIVRYFSRAGRRDASARIAGSEERGRGGRSALSEPVLWASSPTCRARTTSALPAHEPRRTADRPVRSNHRAGAPRVDAAGKP